MPDATPKLWRVYVYDRWKQDRVKQVYRHADSREEAIDDYPRSFDDLLRDPSRFVMAEEVGDA